jgi:hypothetical protein
LGIHDERAQCIQRLVKGQAQLDERMRTELEKLGQTWQPWQQRDLRRTARTLMSGAGVADEIAERALAHVLQGVRGVYNQYPYLHEKRDAFPKLGALIDSIIDPKDNVVPMVGRKARRAK